VHVSALAADLLYRYTCVHYRTRACVATGRGAATIREGFFHGCCSPAFVTCIVQTLYHQHLASSLVVAFTCWRCVRLWFQASPLIFYLLK